METIYCRLDAKRLTLCGQKASGGEETVCYAFVPRRQRPCGKTGKIVDLADYRKAAEPQAVPASQPEEGEQVRPKGGRGQRVALAADLCASCAVVIMAAGVLLRFLAL